MAKQGLGLDGRKLLVVGGGRGIGRETALLGSSAGADVVVADIDSERAAAVVAEISELGRFAKAVVGDVTVERDAVRIVAEARETMGGLDGLANIVGLAAWGDLMAVSADMWNLDILRNLTHHLYLCRAAARQWIDDGTIGSIALVASVSGIYGAPNHAAYGAAKAGLIDLVRTMSQEWAPYGIRVNAIAPDMIATPRILAAMEANGRNFDEDARADGVPLGRAGRPDEIAGPLVFMLSDLASFVTGQTLVVDGGTRAMFPHVRGSSTMPRGAQEAGAAS